MTQKRAESPPRIPAWYWLAFALAPFLFLGLLMALDRPAPVDPASAINSARWLADSRMTPPPAGAGWSDWEPLPITVSTYPKRSSVWYQIALPATVDADLLALHSPHTEGNLTLFVDDIEIASGGSRQPPVAHHQGSLLFEVPGKLLRQADRVLVHRTAMDGKGGLPRLYLASASALWPVHQQQRLFQFWTPLTILIFMVVIILIMLTLYALRPQDSTYFWYAVTLTAWAGYQAWGIIYAPPVTNPALWRALSYVAIGGLVTASVFFIHRFLDLRLPRFERALLLCQALASAIVIGLAAVRDMRFAIFGLMIWIPCINLLGLYNVHRLFRSTLARPIFERLCLLLITFVVAVVGVRDYVFDLTGIQVSGYSIPGTTYYLPFAAGAVLIGFSLILMTRFARALDTAETMNTRLGSLVAEKSAELEANYAQLRDAERNRTLAGERERIMRDVHDGLGNQLMRLLSVAEQAPELRGLAPGIRDALRDVRLIVDSLAPNDGDLLGVLASFRNRVEKDLNRAGLRFNWNVRDVPLIEDLNPERVVSILRIVQECVTNTLKHGNARTITVTTHYVVDEHCLVLTLTDDGQGFDPQRVAAGRGLANMQRRAALIGATLTINNSSTASASAGNHPGSPEEPGVGSHTGARTGTRVTLRLPVEIRDPSSGL